MKYRVSINIDEVARQVNTTVDNLRSRIYNEVEKLSISTHAFIVAKANSDLRGYMREAFLGKDNKNVRWTKVSDQIWAVEIDESARWIEEGKSATFMRWLLDNNPKAKTAKDGSRYAHIPFTHAKLAGANDKTNDPKQAYEAIVRKTLKENKISLRKIERLPDGSPKLGVLHTVPVDPPGSPQQFPGFFSMPRNPEMARLTGLPQHSGIFHLKGLMVTQRLNQKGKPVREAVTIRTISSKHEAEGRWFAKEIKPLASLDAAQSFAESEWHNILEAIKAEFR
jgi:hypothetical protein